MHGIVTARFKIPAGYTLDGGVKLKTPLSTTLFDAVSTSVEDGMLAAQFRKSDIDNNIPEGDSVPADADRELHPGRRAEATDVHGEREGRQVNSLALRE